jgi:manganese transport system ATP-binding protein
LNAPDPHDAVVARDLVLRRGSRVAIDRSSFTIPAGRITAIIGPNGSGKSTLLHAIAGLLTPSEGHIDVLGHSPSNSSRRTSGVSYVLQHTDIAAGTPLTVREAVGMARYPRLGLLRRPSREDRAKVDEAMSLLKIADLAERHLTELSGGQRQRVYVAQGVAQDHDILLLDEPLTGLDLLSAKTIDAIIHEEPEHGCAVVLTTHDLEEAAAADHVLLTCGRVLASGPPSAVLTSANLATAYGLGALHDIDERAPLLPTEHHEGHDHSGEHGPVSAD